MNETHVSEPRVSSSVAFNCQKVGCFAGLRLNELTLSRGHVEPVAFDCCPRRDLINELTARHLDDIP
jgi:hypothetical protein